MVVVPCNTSVRDPGKDERFEQLSLGRLKVTGLSHVERGLNRPTGCLVLQSDCRMGRPHEDLFHGMPAPATVGTDLARKVSVGYTQRRKSLRRSEDMLIITFPS